MRKTISLIFLSNTGHRVKQVTIPVSAIFLLVVLGVVGTLALGWALRDYLGLRQTVAKNHRMAQTIDEQRGEISQQRLQIQSFAREIDDLKDNLVRLDRFEKKIRVIANVEPQRDADNLFGVGGAAPEDLNPQLDPSQRHDALIREMHAQLNELDAASLRKEANFDTLLDKLEGQRSLLASTPAIKPAEGWITSRFGYRTSPFTGRKEFHKGFDIANRNGTAVMASADGVVTFVGQKNGMGNVVVIDHGHGLLTRYAHLSKSLKKRGESVKRGDIIAQMGSSGRSTGPHLHYEVHLNGVAVNPGKYILD
jgi:murein DD-endopeptidase MepM/ murein hydrolase activator NlpD